MFFNFDLLYDYDWKKCLHLSFKSQLSLNSESMYCNFELNCIELVCIKFLLEQDLNILESNPVLDYFLIIQCYDTMTRSRVEELEGAHRSQLRRTWDGQKFSYIPENQDVENGNKERDGRDTF